MIVREYEERFRFSSPSLHDRERALTRIHLQKPAQPVAYLIRTGI
jgi:hypothetical protein